MTSLAAVRSSANVMNGSAQTADLDLSCDVCVIGSGAGGAVTASTLAGAGIDVLIVEEGGYYSTADFTMHERDVYPKLYQEAMQRATSDGAIGILQGRAVGGTTVVNYTTSFRTPETVIDHWQKKHAVKGFTYADLVPHWDWIEKRLGIHKVPEEEMNLNNRKLFEGCRAMGWQAETLHRNVVACMQSGMCGLGCPVNAKRSMLVTLVPDAIDAGARLLYRVRIDRIETNGGTATKAIGTLLDAEGLKPTGKRVTIKAKRFVLSGGAINSPALLLRSGITLGGLVGERTFLHPVVGSIAYYDEIIDPWRGAPQSAASHHFADRGEKVGVFFETIPFYPAIIAGGTPGFGNEHTERLGRARHAAGHIVLAIDGFHDDVPGGRVRLRPNGQPVLDYPIPASLWESLRFGQRRLAEAGFASGAKRVMTLHDPGLEMATKDDISRIESMPYKPGAVPVFTAHQMGGCRMGSDPRTSVVRSEDLRMHDFDNIWVMDGSVFPTSLGVNPQESIYGLTRMMATRFTEKRA
jgi:choline dehydrogenase-like flavoprotein